MGFVKPYLPDFDYDLWRARPRADRIKAQVLHWGNAGFGTPDAVYLLYILKIALYIAVGVFFIKVVAGAGFTTLVAFQKVVLWTLLFEVLGLGCGFGPLTLRFLPPLGTFLYWLRPGTVRLPPWRLPGTRGTARTPLDIGLYAAVLAAATWALVAPGLISVARLLPLLILLPAAGLRDKTIFLAARAEVYGTLAVTFLLPGIDMIATAKLFLVLLWSGAATSKLNRHFPYVISVMMSNNPLLRPQAVKRAFFRSYPDDMRPGAVSHALALTGTVIEFTVPVVLLLSRGGALTYIAAAIMVSFHLLILTSIPLGVPLEWNVFMIFSILYLFVHYAWVGPTAITHPLPAALLLAAVAATIVTGNLAPRSVSFLPAMRYYAGNWDTSLWCFKPGATELFEAGIKKAAALPATQLTRLYGDQVTDLLVHKGMAFRAMHSHGRALYGLVERLCGPTHETYQPVEGELIAGVVLGWNFGDGHLHNRQLIDAVQERCQFAPGDVRVVVLDAQPMQRQSQHYQLIDAATGLLEEGSVSVADMLARQPWTPDFPVTPVTTVPAEPAPA